MSAIVAALRTLQQTTPDRPLIHQPNSGPPVDASALWAMHLRYRQQLEAAGLQPGHLVAAATRNSASFIALFVASRALRLPLVAVDATATASEVRELAARHGAAALVVAEGTVVSGDASAPLGEGLVLAIRHRASAVDPGIALMKVTSGSTGAPRTTITTEPQLIADFSHIAEGMRIGPDDTQLAVIPLSHSYGFSSLVMPLLMQGTPIVLRESFIPPQLVADARAFRARVFPGVPVMFQSLLADPPREGWPGELRTLISAGAPLPIDVARGFVATFGVKIRSFYGTSETGGIAFDESDDLQVCDRIGRSLPGVSIALVPDADAPEGAGRVFVRSAAVSSGYFGGADPTFRDGGYLTGDYGVLDADGRIALIGRASSFVNVAGKKVAPREVEGVLRRLSGVRDVHVAAATDGRRGEHVVAYLVVDRPVTALTVRRFCARLLAPHKVPRSLYFVTTIPRTVRGKVDMKALGRFGRAQT